MSQLRVASVSTTQIQSTTGNSAMTVASSGTTTQPKVVHFHVTGTSSVTSAGANIPYNIVNRDTHSGYNTSTYQYTIPISGTYHIDWQFFTNGGSAGAADFYVSGTRYLRTGREYSDTSYFGCTGGITMYLSAGDYIYMYVYTGSVHINQNYSQFSGFLVG